MSSRFAVALLIVGGIAYVLFQAWTRDQRMTELIQPCELVFLEDISSGDQRRLRVFVFSDAQSLEGRAATAMAAAVSLYRVTGYDYMQVFLSPVEAPRARDLLPMSSAVAQFAPVPSRIPFMDREWEVEATDRPFSETLPLANMVDMVEFAEEYEGSAGPREGCALLATWTG
jgi:hypothetical protein